jgi:nicotinamidase-related amidase
VFGVATEYCVQRAAEGLLRRGHPIAIVTDAVRSIDPDKGRQVLANLHSNGARLITTEDALALLGVSP